MYAFALVAGDKVQFFFLNQKNIRKGEIIARMKQQHHFDSALFADNSQPAGFSMAELLAAHPMPGEPDRNSIVTGEVVAAIKQGYLVSLGLKCDSLVRDAEPGELEVGKSYQFYVLDETDAEGEAELSYRKAAIWQRLTKLAESGEVVIAQVHRDSRRAFSRANSSDRIGGLIAYIDGIRSFIPRGQVPQYVRLDSLVGQEIPVTVLSADPSKGRGGAVVLSHLAGVNALRMARLAELNSGDVLPGQIVAVIDSGVLVNLGGELTGLVPRTEVGGDRTGDALRQYKPGQSVTVKVISRNLEKGKISLSIRGARQAEFLSTLTKGAVITGKVARFESYGAFVCIGDCMDGLLHIEDYGTQGGRREKLAAGQEIEVEVLEVDIERGRVALGRKKLQS